MSPLEIIRAWKDPEYRLSLSEAERALVPNHPAGMIELADPDLEGIGGGKIKFTIILIGCPTFTKCGGCTPVTDVNTRCCA